MGWFRKGRGPPKREEPKRAVRKKGGRPPSARMRTADLRAWQGRIDNFRAYMNMLGLKGEGELSSATAALGELMELNKMNPGHPEVLKMHEGLQSALIQRKDVAVKKQNLADMLETDKMRIEGAIVFGMRIYVDTLADEYRARASAVHKTGQKEFANLLIKAAGDMGAIADSISRRGEVSQMYTQQFTGGKAAKEAAKAPMIQTARNLFATMEQRMAQIGQIAPPARKKRK